MRKKQREFTKIKKSDGSIVYRVKFLHDNIPAIFVNQFNNISKTFLGLFIDSSVNTMALFLKQFPDIFTSGNIIDFDKWLIERKFIETEADNIELLTYS